MDLGKLNFNFLGMYNASQLKKVLNGTFKDHWGLYEKRQNDYYGHSNTRTIPILFNDSNPDDPINAKKFSPYYEAFKDELEKLEKLLKNKISKNGFITNFIIVKLDSNSYINPHKDVGLKFHVSKRIHLPLYTAPGCIFMVDSEEKYMKEGELWEINNIKRHGVFNSSKADRVHVIIDFFSEEFQNYKADY